MNYLKGICAILVVLIHTHLIGKAGMIPFYRTAVPLFFMISGYFLMGNNGKWQKEKIGQYLKKMLGIWGITNVIYLLFSYFVFTEYNPFHTIQHINAYNILQLSIIEIIFGGQLCGPLWYITSYIWVLILLRFWKYQSNVLIISLISILLLINLLLGSYNFLLPIDVCQPYANRNFLTTGLPFVMLGGFIKNKTEYYRKYLKIKIAFCLSFLCYVELLFLYIMNSKDGDIFLTTPILSTFIFIWFTEHSNFGKESWMIKIGKKYSLNIYLLHTLVIWLINTYSTYIEINIRRIEFLLVLPITIVICIIIQSSIQIFTISKPNNPINIRE